jgi:hypothetical protein
MALHFLLSLKTLVRSAPVAVLLTTAPYMIPDAQRPILYR